NNRMEIIPKGIKFKKIIKKTIAGLQYIRNANNIKISIKIENDELLYSDKYRIKVIFMNLISNAISYQQKDSINPALLITIKTTSEFSEIEFRDNGIGIEEKYRSKVFDMFFRGTVHSTGSGLGLYITKEIIAKLGGQITLVSEENKGTSIVLRIPNLISQIYFLNDDHAEQL
ncbi:MAG TPA: HAMP domain-containing sensor histidine kinase, partial [Cytophagaceae bacterium]|nr:HAMP domain-containing sensor histidine kinase [Cytophagaceae bacterium]